MDLKQMQLDEYTLEQNFVGSCVSSNSACSPCVSVAREVAKHDH